MWTIQLIHFQAPGTATANALGFPGSTSGAQFSLRDRPERRTQAGHGYLRPYIPSGGNICSGGANPSNPLDSLLMGRGIGRGKPEQRPLLPSSEGCSGRNSELQEQRQPGPCELPDLTLLFFSLHSRDMTPSGLQIVLYLERSFPDNLFSVLLRVAFPHTTV